MIGLRTPGELVSINFGQKKFRFDIEGYRRVFAFKILKISKSKRNL